MSKKSIFSSSEWQLVTDGPEWVLAALSAADNKPVFREKAKESKAFKDAVEDFKSRSELVNEVISDKAKPSDEIKDASVSDAIKALTRINDILTRKIGQSEADAYRRFLKKVGKVVAEAVSEESGAKLTDAEEKTLKKINVALESKEAAGSIPGAISFKSHKVKKEEPKKAPVKKPVARTTPDLKKAPAMEKADAPKSKYLAVHTVESGESLSYIAKVHYGSGSRENWMKIYEENKKLIGDNPNLIRVGQVLNIPHL